jgi:hypothetical protein
MWATTVIILCRMRRCRGRCRLGGGFGRSNRRGDVATVRDERGSLKPIAEQEREAESEDPFQHRP